MNDAIHDELESPPLQTAWRDAAEARVPVVALPQPARLDTVELVSLYNAVNEAAGSRSHNIVQFVCATKGASGEGHAEIAYNFAWTGTALLGKRVLFVDARAGATDATPNHKVRTKFLADVAFGRAVAEEAMIRQADLNLFVATLQHERTGGSQVLAAKQIRALLEGLRSDFDMIVIAPAPVLDHPMAGILTTIVDGSVIVVEAGRTRARELARCSALLSSGDSPVIGAVMQGARNHTPRWLRRWL